MKSYTDIEQSRKLAKILPIESADMKILSFGIDIKRRVVPIDDIAVLNKEDEIPCWSLAALLSVLPNYQLQTQNDGIGVLCSCNGNFNIVTADNSVDACVAMIEKLHDTTTLETKNCYDSR